MPRLSPLLILLLTLPALSGCVSIAGPMHSEADGTALAVGPLKHDPIFDGNITSDEWANATRINGVFEIHDGSKADGAYPFNLWIGTTSDGLAIAVRIENKTGNPFSDESRRFADHLAVFFDTVGQNGLVPPEFWISGATYDQSAFTGVGFWNGYEWQADPHGDYSDYNNGHPSGGTWVNAKSEPGATSFEIYTPRHPAHSIRNSLDLGAGAEFRMALLYMRQGDIADEVANAHGDFAWPRDTFPGGGWNPNGTYDPVGWLHFRLR